MRPGVLGVAGDSSVPQLSRAAWPLRTMALLIAVAAVIDPVVTSARRTRPALSLVSVDTIRDRVLLARTRQLLDRHYTVVAAPLPSALGTVLVGARLPTSSNEMAAPVVVVSPESGIPSVAICRIQAPTQAMLESRVDVLITLTTRGIGAGTARTPEVELTVGGGVVVARQRIAAAHDTVLTVSLAFVPSAPGPVVLQARAFVPDQSDTVRSDVLVNVREHRWSVLFFDRRPSWMSTFVRRALERDPRFAVTSRIITSTNVSRLTGQPPQGLDAVASTSPFDAVVIGAPDALLARDVDGISTLLRARGASVVVLADHAANGPADALLDIGGWRAVSRRVPAELTAPAVSSRAREPLRLRGMSIGVPQRLAPSAVPLAVLRAAPGNAKDMSKDTGADEQTVVWQVPVGLGQLVISGAFDTWRYRDTAQSTFDATWRDIIDDAASQRLLPLDVRVSSRLVTPRANVLLTILPRDSANSSPIRASLRALSPAAAAAATEFTVAADDGGTLHTARFRAPPVAGHYEVVVYRGPDTVRTPLVVAPTVAADADNNPELLAAWASSRGGRVVPANRLESLAGDLDRVLRPVPLVGDWHPMRSPWWIIPFSFALAAEWWIRRRRGLA